MSRRRRGQLVLLAAAVVVTALIPMLLAYAQLGAHPDVGGRAEGQTMVTDAKRVLERSVTEATTTLGDGRAAGRHREVTEATIDRLEPTVATIESSGTRRGVAVAVERNVTAARAWAGAACPGGPNRAFGTCRAIDGVVTQTRANTTTLVAVAFDVRVRSPDGTTEATFVVRGVRGAVADRRATGNESAGGS